ncbi:MAG: hypothetical protein HC933_13860 [Pleurocapsa sp. SU_196_0]|nr:hypothetical protein [Pleurocapsa sp. SU_196_0]
MNPARALPAPRVGKHPWLPLLLIPVTAALGAWWIMTSAPVLGTSFVGRLESNTELIALAPREHELVAFVTDSRKRATWFRGPNRAPLELRASDGSVLRGQVQEDTLYGEVQFSDTSLPRRFAAQPAQNEAGLYLATPARTANAAKQAGSSSTTVRNPVRCASPPPSRISR